MMIAQALLERTWLDTASMSLAHLFSQTSDLVVDRPYLLGIVVVVLLLLIRRPR
jgi:hypothetical protein